MTVIPQDPYLFKDTIRNNMDPEGLFQDSEIESVLTELELMEKFKLEGGLQYMIDTSGGNLSQGEKQLVCLARALLQNKKLVLLDEATANFDLKTERLIQECLFKQFKHSTILMIAHRLETILNCDYILVL